MIILLEVLPATVIGDEVNEILKSELEFELLSFLKLCKCALRDRVTSLSGVGTG